MATIVTVDTIEEFKKLNKNVTCLTFGRDFSQKIILSKNITKKAQLFFVG